MPSSRRSVSHSKGQKHLRTAGRGVSPSELKPQTTISELFATSKRIPAASEDLETQGLNPSKRPKLMNTQTSTDTPHINLPPTEMYKFAPGTPRRNGDPHTIRKEVDIIDLTGPDGAGPFKPSSSPRKPGNHIRPTAPRPQGGPKKLVVKNLKKTPRSDPDQYYNHIWGQLDMALSAIFTGGPLPYSLEELYKGVESLCRQDRAPEVYTQLRERCKHNLSVCVLDSLPRDPPSTKSTDVLEAVVKAWSTWRKQLVASSWR